MSLEEIKDEKIPNIMTIRFTGNVDIIKGYMLASIDPDIENQSIEYICESDSSNINEYMSISDRDTPSYVITLGHDSSDYGLLEIAKKLQYTAKENRNIMDICIYKDIGGSRSGGFWL